MVLLHGQPGTRHDWRRVVDRLAGRYHLVVPDRPGYGETGGPATGFAGNARAVADLLDRIGTDRAVVVGHSWAGAAALAFASAFPARTSGLVLVSSVAPGVAPRWDDRLLGSPVVGEVMAAATVGSVRLLLAGRRALGAGEGRLPDRVEDAFTALARLARSPTPVWRSFLVEQRALLADLDGDVGLLPAIGAPTVILHGEADHMVDPAAARRLADTIPGARLRRLAGAGHLLPYDAPDSVATAVDDVAGTSG